MGDDLQVLGSALLEDIQAVEGAEDSDVLAHCRRGRSQDQRRIGHVQGAFRGDNRDLVLGWIFLHRRGHLLGDQAVDPVADEGVDTALDQLLGFRSKGTAGSGYTRCLNSHDSMPPLGVLP